MRKIYAILLLCFSFAFADSGVVYQHSIPAYLLRGQYGAVVTVKQAKQEGVNLGIGAGVNLGELIVVDGKFYLADPHGKLSQLKDSNSACFLTGVNFIPQQAYTFSHVTSLNNLQDLIESKISTSNSNSFYAVKVIANHANITARSENFNHVPYTPINEWIKNNQNVFSLKNIPVTLVMFRTPHDLSQLNLKYHAHFISNNKTIGGHVFNFSASNVTIQIAQFDKVMIYLPTKQYPVIKNAKVGTMHDFTHIVESQ